MNSIMAGIINLNFVFRINFEWQNVCSIKKLRHEKNHLLSSGLSFPRRRESSFIQECLDSRLRGNDKEKVFLKSQIRILFKIQNFCYAFCEND